MVNKKGEKMSYSADEVKANCLKFFENDELATNVVMNKYLLRDDEGNYLENGPEDMLNNRIAKEFARIEKKYPNSLSQEEIYESLKDFKYIIPQGSPLAGIGNEQQVVSLGNCFVVGQPEDSYGGIMKKDEELVQIMKRRGGVGLDISTIRPSGSVVRNSAKTSSGIQYFMERYSNTTKEVAQAGGRRGALLLSIDCRHPDIDQFIEVKRDKTKITGANISIKWNDDFLNAISNDEEYVLRYPVDVDIKDAKVTKKVKAKEIWNKFVESNWEGAEPGCLYWDTMITQNITDCYADDGFKTISTNPCGEVALSQYGACILMLVNLNSFIDNPFSKTPFFDKKLFEKHVRRAVRLIDDMIDLEIEKVDKIISKIKSDPESEEIKIRELSLWQKVRQNYIRGRRVGLGITGLGDMIASMNIKYDSEESLEFVKEVFKLFHMYSYDESSELAKERGPFELWNWGKEKNSHYINILPKEIQEKIKNNGRRHIGMNTCSPAGSISLLTKTTSGIEPLYMMSYKRNRKMTEDDLKNGCKEAYIDSDGIKWISYDVYHHGVTKWQENNKKMPIEKSPYYGCEAGQLDWHFRVKMQGLINFYVDHSISSTVNLSKDITKEEVSQLYLEAWKNKCKGITIYRDGSRQGVLTAKTTETNDSIKINHAPKRKQILPCDINYSNIKNSSGGTDQWIIFVGLDNGVPYEIFGGKKSNIEIPKKYKTGWVVKNGKDAHGRRTYDLYLGTMEDTDERMIIKDIVNVFSSDVTAYTRIVSTMIRHGVPIKIICEQLLKNSDSHLFTFEKAISRVLKKFIKDGEKSSNICEKCGGEMQYNGGCSICLKCGSSKCF